MRTICVGDVHGCLDELKLLLDRVNFKQGSDRLVLLGDLVDRGPRSAECVRFAREIGAEVVLGNHEEKALRWLRHDNRAKQQPGYKNPMRVKPERTAQYLALSSEDIEWLQQLPVCLDLGYGFVAIHGGFEPGRSLGQQRPDKVIRVRWVDGNGKSVSIGRNLEQPPNTYYWTEMWEGPVSVVYGHAVHSLTKPRIDQKNNIECWGIDTGCCFGGRLTALILPEMRVVQVEALKEYTPWHLNLSTDAHLADPIPMNKNLDH